MGNCDRDNKDGDEGRDERRDDEGGGCGERGGDGSVDSDDEESGSL